MHAFSCHKVWIRSVFQQPDGQQIDGQQIEEVALETGVALAEGGDSIRGRAVKIRPLDEVALLSTTNSRDSIGARIEVVSKTVGAQTNT